MIVTANDYINFLLGIEPDFEDDYQKCLQTMNAEISSHGITSAFYGFVSKKLRSGDYKNANAVFNGLETLLVANTADETIKNAVCTCFLENLFNNFTEEPNILEKFVPLLGPESIKYCKAWDEFTGVKTDGLWGTENPKFKSKFELSDVEALTIIEAIKLQKYKNEIEEGNKIRLLELAFPGISNLLFYDRRGLTPSQILAEARNRIDPKSTKG